ncbi:hypothetical protein DFH08DRAFT_960690 [Mycena albidolilacea]|uniref:RNase H type-1 domain-containing protein n=1 Tax=Mycena albidolilacea TaxID=1033008 RepID=A0AAD7ES34_9AGAR|nr:hypothetical protein DFH08DRAFT_960690 [Mycena albidolilacea]
MSIAPDKNTARAEQESVERAGGFCVYTDGLGFEGGVGAAAVAWNGGKEGKVRTKHLGPEDEYTVFESEVVGAILALDIIASTARLTSEGGGSSRLLHSKPSPHSSTAPSPRAEQRRWRPARRHSRRDGSSLRLILGPRLGS